jgi:hypothetical protein
VLYASFKNKISEEHHKHAKNDSNPRRNQEFLLPLLSQLIAPG